MDVWSASTFWLLWIRKGCDKHSCSGSYGDRCFHWFIIYLGVDLLGPLYIYILPVCSACQGRCHFPCFIDEASKTLKGKEIAQDNGARLLLGLDANPGLCDALPCRNVVLLCWGSSALTCASTSSSLSSVIRGPFTFARSLGCRWGLCCSWWAPPMPLTSPSGSVLFWPSEVLGWSVTHWTPTFSSTVCTYNQAFPVLSWPFLPLFVNLIC